MNVPATEITNSAAHELTSIAANFTNAAADKFQKELDYAKTSGKLTDVLRSYKTMQDAYDELDEVRKKLYQQLEFMSRNLIPDRMSEEGVKTISLEDMGYRFTISARVSASMLDKTKGLEWLRETGNEGIIQETVNSSTLSAFAKSYLKDNGADLPQGIFKVSTMRFTSCTKI